MVGLSAASLLSGPKGSESLAFYIKLQGRLLRPLLEADKPSAPIELRRALGTIDHLLGDYITGERLGTGAWNLSQDPETWGPRRTRRSRELAGTGPWRALCHQLDDSFEPIA